MESSGITPKMEAIKDLPWELDCSQLHDLRKDPEAAFRFVIMAKVGLALLDDAEANGHPGYITVGIPKQMTRRRLNELCKYMEEKRGHLGVELKEAILGKKDEQRKTYFTADVTLPDEGELPIPK